MQSARHSLIFQYLTQDFSIITVEQNGYEVVRICVSLRSIYFSKRRGWVFETWKCGTHILMIWPIDHRFERLFRLVQSSCSLQY